ncbi:MAG: LLM class flavin-dependent oxidoreductase [Alphaproteobacteria bacterium]|nr:LLM class flavin-dependent oxidoreductase [Alphaproteobacteria bacterium]
MPKIGIRFDGFEDAPETFRVAALAEEAGATGLWMTEHIGYRESLVSCMAFAMKTKNAMVIPAAVTPYLFHPTPTAMSLATMAEAFPGRVGVSVAIGNTLDMKESGKEPQDAVQTVEEYVRDLRAMWSTEPVQSETEAYNLAGARMSFKTEQSIPIFVTALGSEVASKAGEVADGMLMSAGFSVPFVENCLKLFREGAEKAGRDASVLRTAAFIHFSVSEDGTSAREDVRRKLAFLFRNRLMAENIASSGIPIDQDAIVDAVAARDLEKAATYVPDDAIEAFGVAGTVADCKKSLEAYVATGLDEPVIQVAGDEESKTLALQVIREFTG